MNEPGSPTGRSRQLWTMPCEATSAHQGHHWRHPAIHPRCDPRRHMTHMRLNGELRWDWVVDETRRRHVTETYDGVDEALEACAQFYRANTGE
jgi:hypothetical protein